MRVPREANSGRRRVATALTAALIALLGVLAGTAFSADVPIATVNVDMAPAAVAVNPLSHAVYVANYYGNTVSVIDGTTDSNEATIPMPVGYTIGAVPNAVVVDPLASPARAYVANWQSHIVSFIDESTFTRVATVTVPASNGLGNPRALALWATSSPPKLYVANYHRNSVSVLDAQSGASLAEIPVGASPRALAIFTSAGRNRLYVANRYSNDVSIVDMDTDSVVATAPTGAAPKAFAVDQASGHVFVTSPTSDTVTVIDDNDTVVANVAVGDNPLGIALDETGGRVFVADYASNDVAVIDAATNSLVSTIPVAAQPWAVAFDQGDRKAFVTNYGAAQVTIVDRDLAVTTCAVGTNPYALAIDEGASPHKAYCANWGSNTVTVIDEPAAVGSRYGAQPAMAEGAPAPGPVATSVTPFAGGVALGPRPVFTGTASSTRSPYRTPIAAVFVRLDGAGSPLVRAEITAGSGTPDVSWRYQPAEPLVAGSHEIEVVVFDAASASPVSAGLDQGGRSAIPAGGGTYAFDVSQRLEQDDPRLHYESAWSTTTASPLSGGSDRRVNAAGGAVDIAFEGTGFSWISTKAPMYGQARVTVDGSAETTVDLYAPGALYQQRVFTRTGLANGPHTARIEWTGAKNPASSGTLVRLDAVDVIGSLTQASSPFARYEQTDTRLFREGVWKSTASTSLSGGTDAWTNSAGGAMDVAFTGTRFTWISTKAPMYGQARVTVDGSAETTVDLYAPGVAYQQPVFSLDGLADAPHTVRIEWTGERNAFSTGTMVRVDAVEVAGALTQATSPLNRYEQTDTRLFREGLWKATTSASLSGGSDAWVNSVGGAMDVAFTGTAFSWISTTAPFYGIARVIVDGTAEKTVDLYSPGVAYQRRVLTLSGLSPGPHTVRIEWTGDHNAATTGTVVRVDAVEVLGTLTQAP